MDRLPEQLWLNRALSNYLPKDRSKMIVPAAVLYRDVRFFSMDNRLHNVDLRDLKESVLDASIL